MCTGASVLHTECGWERGEVGTALARDEQNLPMNEKPTGVFVVDRPTFSWESAEEPQRSQRSLDTFFPLNEPSAFDCDRLRDRLSALAARNIYIGGSSW